MTQPSTAVKGLPESTLRVGDKLGAYVVEGLLGMGGMAEVYAVRHSVLDKRLALKILKPEPARSEELRQRFLREGQSASRIVHAHIVAINDVVDDGERVYIVMELLEGETLGAVMERDVILPVERILEYLIPILSAMGAAHLRGVVHRDLKPDNIFLARDASGRAFPKVLDFGVSMLADHVAPRVTATDTVLGTPHYMAPEQALGRRDVDGRADQFALGIIFYEAIVGRLPYSGTSSLELIHEVARGEVVRPSVFKSSVPKELENVLMRALQANPEDRYPTMEEFGLACLPFASERTQDQWRDALSGLTHRSGFPAPTEGRYPSSRERAVATMAQRPARMTPAVGSQPDSRRSTREDALAESGQRTVQRSAIEAAVVVAAPQSPKSSVAEPADRATASSVVKPKTEPTKTEVAEPTSESTKAEPTKAEPTKTAVEEPTSEPHAATSTPAAKPRGRLLAGLGALALVGAGVAGLFGWSARPLARSVQLVPAAEVRVDGRLIGTGSLVTITLPNDGASHHIVVSAEGHRAFEATLIDVAHLPASIRLDEEAVAPEAAIADVATLRDGTEARPEGTPPEDTEPEVSSGGLTVTGMSERRPNVSTMRESADHEPEEDLRFVR